MPVNINEDALAQLGNKVSRGDTSYLDASKVLNPNLHVRLMMGHPNMKGIPFFFEEGYWINKQRYVSPKTFGEPCPIAEEIEEAEALGDPEIDQLLSSRLFSDKPTIMAPVLALKVDDQYNVTGVQGDKVKILQMGKMLFGEMYGVLTGTPQISPSTILDPKEGYNMILTKSGSGMSTQYTAKIWMRPTEFDPEWFDLEGIPDIVELTRKKLKPENILRAAIRNFLYGEEAPVESDDDGDEPATFVKKNKISPPKRGGKKRSLLDDVKNS